MSSEPKNLQQIVKELKREIKHLQSLVVKDELTGVLNRRGLTEEIGIFFNDISYLQKHPANRRNFNIDDLAILFIDVDSFKKINDKFGHDGGDAALRFISFELQKRTRRIDLVGRWGGDEFVVALIGMDEDSAYKKGEALRKLISSKNVSERHKGLKVEVSIGVASAKNSGAKSTEGLISVADKAMYYAKLKNHKNCTVKYSDIKTKPERIPRKK
jgi:diguanylate cyclase (GGDEF)-like protein